MGKMLSNIVLSLFMGFIAGGVVAIYMPTNFKAGAGVFTFFIVMILSAIGLILEDILRKLTPPP